MLDLKALREKPEEFKKALRKKHVDPVQVDNLISLDREKRLLTQEVEELYAKRNRASKEMGELKDKKSLRAHSASARPNEDLAAPVRAKVELIKKEMVYVKERLGELEPKLEKLSDELKNLFVTLPNPPLPSVPEGVGDSENKVIKTVGKPPTFPFEPKDHMELGKLGNSIDTETASSVSGTRFYYLKNQTVQLEFALAQFVISKLMKKGFTPVIPPVLVKEHAMFSTGFFPADRNEIYHVNPEDDDLYLVGTAEVPLCMLYADKILDGAELPKRFVGFSTCFRREAGSYGKDTHGILRVHQFDKVEMFSFCHPEKSEEEHEFILEAQEEIMQDLGLHYQVVNICGGDLGAPAAKKYDIEAWIPSQKCFRELTSASNCTDFQSRRANIRYRKQVTSGKKQEVEARFVHTLNGTAVAMSRMIIAIMENFQTEKGEIKIPACLKKFIS